MNTNWKRGKNIGGLLELTVSDVLQESVEALIDQGKRFTIINDVDLEEDEDYGGRISES